jgi:hypothetical protein
MKATSVIFSVLLLLSPPVVAAPVPKGVESGNLIVNGSFEDVSDDDAGRPQDKGSTALKGWW